MACAAGALAGFALSASAAAQSAETEAPPQAISEAATRVANWIAYSGDNGSLPYMIIDKNAATVFLFDAEGKSIGQAQQVNQRVDQLNSRVDGIEQRMTQTQRQARN